MEFTGGTALHFVLITLCIFEGIVMGSAGTVRIAWMVPAKYYYYFNASTSMGALVYAIETVQNDPSLLPGYDFDVRWADSDCNSKQGIGAIFDVLLSGYDPHVIIGPICSVAMNPVAQIGAYRNLPVFGWLSSNAELENKKKYNTLVRLFGPLTAMGEGFIIMFGHFNWKQVFLISLSGEDYGQLARGVRSAFQLRHSEGYSITRWVQDLSEDLDTDSIKDIFALVKKEARIVILCVPIGELRRWLLAAYDMGMSGGDYVFLYPNQIIPTALDVASFASTTFYTAEDGRNEDAKQMYENLLMVFQKTLDFDTTQEFFDKFYAAANTGTWRNTITTPSKSDLYSLWLYDTMMLYAKVATEAGSIDDGSKLYEYSRNALMTGGATGTVLLSDTADRYPDYWVMDMNSSGVFDITAETQTTRQGSQIIRTLVESRAFIWGDGTSGVDNAPLDQPTCGYQGELCPTLELYIAPAAAVFVTIVIIVITSLIYRRYRHERELQSMVWIVNVDDLHLYTGNKHNGSQAFIGLSRNLHSSHNSDHEETDGQMFVKVANYRGTLVAVKDVKKDSVKLDRPLLTEMNKMMELKHGNLTTFIGAGIDGGRVCVVWEYCSKGSVQDVIWNDNINLDDMFKYSVAIDMLKGLIYLHDSSLKCHGCLRSSNTVIDGRWVCKLTDFGLHCFKEGEEMDSNITEHVQYTKMFWTAPELLVGLGEVPGDITFTQSSDVTQSGDVYSAGVILKEIFCRNGPYTEYEELSPKDVIYKVINSEKPLHPSLSEYDTPKKLKDLISSCWSRDPKERPTAHQALKALSKVNPFKKTNVMDNMIAMMEKYSNHLEEIVAERTVQLEEEKHKTEALLYRMLPRSVAENLKLGKPVKAESFDMVSIYFSDIVSFTTLAAASSPLQVVDLLNNLYILFDGIISQYDVYKVETIGDAYMLVSGLPVRNGSRHIVEIVNTAMELLSGVMAFTVPHKPEYSLKVRIGIHSGSVVAGVVGHTMPRYCLFGDTVNTASRMESNGMAMRIHLSSAAYEALCIYGGYHLAARGGIDIKGKGKMQTYWVAGREGYARDYPNLKDLSAEDTPPPRFLPVTLGQHINITSTCVAAPITADKLPKLQLPVAPRPDRESGYSEPKLQLPVAPRPDRESGYSEPKLQLPVAPRPDRESGYSEPDHGHLDTPTIDA